MTSRIRGGEGSYLSIKQQQKTARLPVLARSGSARAEETAAAAAEGSKPSTSVLSRTAGRKAAATGASQLHARSVPMSHIEMADPPAIAAAGPAVFGGRRGLSSEVSTSKRGGTRLAEALISRGRGMVSGGLIRRSPSSGMLEEQETSSRALSSAQPKSGPFRYSINRVHSPAAGAAVTAVRNKQEKERGSTQPGIIERFVDMSDRLYSSSYFTRVSATRSRNNASKIHPAASVRYTATASNAASSTLRGSTQPRSLASKIAGPPESLEVLASSEIRDEAAPMTTERTQVASSNSRVLRQPSTSLPGTHQSAAEGSHPSSPRVTAAIISV